MDWAPRGALKFCTEKGEQMELWSQYRRDQIHRAYIAEAEASGLGDTEATRARRSWLMDPDLFEKIENARAMAPAFKDEYTLMVQCDLEPGDAEIIWALAQWTPVKSGVIATGAPSPSWLVPAAIGAAVVTALGVIL